jgi:hypothetical protein
MSGIKDDEVVQTLSAHRADQPLGVWTPPGVAGRCEDFFDLERSDTRPNVGAINAVPNPAADSAELRVRRSFFDNLLGSLGLGCRTIWPR